MQTEISERKEWETENKTHTGCELNYNDETQNQEYKV